MPRTQASPRRSVCRFPVTAEIIEPRPPCCMADEARRPWEKRAAALSFRRTTDNCRAVTRPGYTLSVWKRLASGTDNARCLGEPRAGWADGLQGRATRPSATVGQPREAVLHVSGELQSARLGRSQKRNSLPAYEHDHQLKRQFFRSEFCGKRQSLQRESRGSPTPPMGPPWPVCRPPASKRRCQ